MDYVQSVSPALAATIESICNASSAMHDAFRFTNDIKAFFLPEPQKRQTCED